MAQKGTYSAYSGAQPIQHNFSDDLKNAENQAFKYREEERIADEKKKAEQEKKEKSKLDSYAKLKAAKTGYNSIDEGIADYVNNTLVTRLNEQYNILDKDPDNWEAKLEIQKITSEPEKIAAMAQILDAKRQAGLEGMVSGEFSLSNKKKEDMLKTMLDDFKFKLDWKDGQTVLNVADGVLDNGIGDDLQKGLTYNNLIDGSGWLGDFEKRWNRDGWATEKIKNIGMHESGEYDKNGNKITGKYVKPSFINNLNAELDSILGTDPENLTWQAKSLLNDYNIPVGSEEELKAAKTKIVNDIISTADTSSNITKATSSTDDKKTSKLGTPVEISDTEGIYGDFSKELKGVKSYELKTPKPTKFGVVKITEGDAKGDYSNVAVENFAIKNGEMYVTGTWQEFKSINFRANDVGASTSFNESESRKRIVFKANSLQKQKILDAAGVKEEDLAIGDEYGYVDDQIVNE